VWRGQGVDREYLLAKLQAFHQVHKTPLVTKTHRGPKPIGELMIPLLIRLGIQVPQEVESETSEARSSD
jgi:hypothetical protein